MKQTQLITGLKPFLSDLFHWKALVAFAATLILPGLVYWFQFDKSFVFGALIIAYITAIYLNKFRSDNIISTGLLFGLLVILSGFYLLDIVPHFNEIKEWDFMAFYIFGKSGAEGTAFYDPASFTNMHSLVQAPEEFTDFFKACVIDVGFCYPPTTMLLLAPIGSLDIHTANIVWRSLILGFLIIDILLVVKLFSLDRSAFINLLLIITLFLLLPGSRTTIELSQTNFFMLFFILMAFNFLNDWKAGVFLALAVIIKPIAVIWGIYFLLTKRWKTIFAFATTGLILVLTTILFFGFHNFVSFFTASPTVRMPDFVYFEDINKSLSAVLIRLNMLFDKPIGTSIMIWIVNLISGLLLLITIIASRKLIQSDRKLAFLIFIPLSLLIYPGSLTHYEVLLLPLLFLLIGRISKISLIFLGLFLIALAINSFVANLLILLVLAYDAIFSIKGFNNFKQVPVS